MRYNKGSSAERELFHKLWDEGFAVVRAAGSGRSRMPSPDLIAGGRDGVFAVECKACKSINKYVDKSEIEQLLKFSEIFNCSPVIAVKFNNKGWKYYDLKNLKSMNKSFKFELSNGVYSLKDLK